MGIRQEAPEQTGVTRIDGKRGRYGEVLGKLKKGGNKWVILDSRTARLLAKVK